MSEATLEELRDRVAQLSAVESRLAAALDEVREATTVAVAERDECARRDMRSRPLGAGTRRGPARAPRRVRLEDARDAIVQLRRFVASELASELGCSPKQAVDQIRRLPHLCRATDRRLSGSTVYEYIEPVGPGAAFEAQQRLGSGAPEFVAERDGGGEVSQSLISSVSSKELRKVVREASRDGWKLVNGGGKHQMQLVREGKKAVRVMTSPQNEGDEAQHMRRKLGL